MTSTLYAATQELRSHKLNVEPDAPAIRRPQGAAGHQAWKDKEAAQASAGYYNDSSVDLTPRDAMQACHICAGRDSASCKACNGKGRVWVETIELAA